jgi:hypothetical protein
MELKFTQSYTVVIHGWVTSQKQKKQNLFLFLFFDQISKQMCQCCSRQALFLQSLFSVIIYKSFNLKSRLVFHESCKYL